jgi:YggT family protein
MVYYLVYKFVDFSFQALYLALMVRVVLSWVPTNRAHPIISAIYEITDPLLRPFQNIVPAWRLGIDLSPLFAFIALGILRKLITQLLF